MTQARAKIPQLSRTVLASLATLATLGALAGEPTAAALEVPSVGLSTVRAQRYGRAELPNANAGGHDIFGVASAAADFNGDGVDDLATGAPGSGGPSPFVSECGEVVVRYGIAKRGLDWVSPPTVLGQFTAGGAEIEDRFGFALAACDFNGDGFGDLAVGVPFEDVLFSTFNFPDAGVVSVYLGSATGLALTPAITVRPSTPTGLPESGMLFGRILACGNFDGDAFDDIVIGVPDHAVGDLEEAGILRVFRGSATGLAPVGYRLDQDSAGIDDTADLDDHFGSSLAVGDFDADGFDDVVVSVPGENFGSYAPAAVHVLFGSVNGLGATGRDQLIPGLSEAHAPSWAHSLATGDFDGDGFDDLVIGSPEDDNFGSNAGGAYVLQGTTGVFDMATADRLTAHDIFDSGFEDNGYFSHALAVGDFNGDDLDDLAIGIPGASPEGILEGAVAVLLAEEGVGITALATHARQFDHGQEEIPSGNVADLVQWGLALTTGDFDGDGFADLAVGAPSEGDVPLSSVGSVTALYGALFADGFGNVSLAHSYWSNTVTPP